MRRRIPLLIGALLLLATALPAPAVLAEAPPDAGDGGLARVVVADVDTGINPYHDAFQLPRGASLPEALLAELGVDAAHRFALTRTGDLAADRAADQARWDAVRPGELHYFEGTRVLGISLAGDGEGTPIRDDDGHGTATAHAILRANPEAIVVMVEGFGEADVAWAARQPWVDLVSTSFGPPGSLPVPGIAAATQEAVLVHHKLHFGASDNSPALAVPDSTAGPWWSIGLAGFQEGQGGGKELFSGTLADFVADDAQDLATHDSETATAPVQGTSFATPRAAGVASRIVLELRREAGQAGGITASGALVEGGGLRVTNWDLRQALNQTARVPALDEWTGAPGLPVLPVAWYAEVGWGVLEPGIVPAAAAHLRDGGPDLKPPDAEAFMEAQFRLRQAYWDAVGG